MKWCSEGDYQGMGKIDLLREGGPVIERFRIRGTWYHSGDSSSSPGFWTRSQVLDLPGPFESLWYCHAK